MTEVQGHNKGLTYQKWLFTPYFEMNLLQTNYDVVF